MIFFQLSCPCFLIQKGKRLRGTGVAQSVEYLTLDFISALDPRVMELSAVMGSAPGVETA